MQRLGVDHRVYLPHPLLEARIVESAVALHEERVAERLLAPHQLRWQELLRPCKRKCGSHAVRGICLPGRARSPEAGAVGGKIGHRKAARIVDDDMRLAGEA